MSSVEDSSPTLKRFCEERLQTRGDDLVCELGSSLPNEAAQLVANPWPDELGQLDVFRLILATGIVALLIGVTLDAAVWEKWVVN